MFFPAGAFFLASDRGQRCDRAFLPRFNARTRLSPSVSTNNEAERAARSTSSPEGIFFSVLKKSILVCGVESLRPLKIFLAREQERNRFIMRVDEKKKRIVANLFAVLVDQIIRVTANQHSQTTPKWRGPLFQSHFVAAGIEPHRIVDLAAGHRLALEKFRPPKDRVLPPQLNQLPGKLEQAFLFSVPLPVEPTNLVVLAIPLLFPFCVRLNSSPPKSIGTPCDKETASSKNSVAAADAKLSILRIVGRSFGAAIPGAIMTLAIAILVAVGFIVFVVITHDIVEREPVVRSDELTLA